MKTIFVVAGFDLHETAANSPAYSMLLDGLRAKGYRVIPYDRAWYRTMPSQYIAEFEEFYREHRTEENIIVGNSFGAVTAFVSAPNLQPDAIYLCSLLPFFTEDRGKYPDEYAYRYFGTRRSHELWSYSFREIAVQINRTGTKTCAIYGEKEHKTSPHLVFRTTEAARALTNARLIEVPYAPHGLEDPAYTQALLKMID